MSKRQTRRTVEGVTDTSPVVPVAQWGRDHWTTLLYFESRAVDYKGVIDNEYMRTNARLHRKMLGDVQIRNGVGGTDYPTRLRDGSTLDLFTQPATPPETLQRRGHADVLQHLGAATVQSVENIIRVVAANKAEWSWDDVDEQLPDGIRQTLALPQFRNAPGALALNAAKQYGYRAVGYVKSRQASARGRAIRVWSAR